MFETLTTFDVLNYYLEKIKDVSYSFIFCGTKNK